MSLRQQVVHALSWTAGAKLAGQAFTWGVTIVVMRLLSPDDYGLLAMAMIFISFFYLFDELGLGPAVVQAQDLSELHLRQVFGSVVVLNAGFLLALVLAAPLISRFFDEPRLAPVIWVLSAHFPIRTVMIVPDALMQRGFHLKAKALIDLGASMTASLSTLAAAWSGLGVWALVIGALASEISRALAYNFVCPFFVRPQFALPSSDRLVRFGLNTLLSRLAWFLYSQADIFIAGKVLGKEALGYYSVGMHWASLPLQKTTEIMFQVVFPTFARIQGDRKLVAASVLKAARVLSLAVFPVLFGLSSVAGELVAVLLGPRWENAAVAIRLLALIMPLRAISSFMFAAADGVGRADLTLRGNVLALVVMPLAMLAASSWGLVGFCAAWLAAYPLVFVLNAAQVLPVVGVSMGSFFAAILRPAAAAAGMYLAVYAARTLWPWEAKSLELLVFLVLTGAIAYLAASYAGNRRACVEAYETFRNRA